MKCLSKEKAMEKLMEKGVLNEKATGRPVLWYEDDFTKFVREHWEVLGLTPVFLNLLISKGWWEELVDECFALLVGKDYADIKITEWIERLKEKGYEFPAGKPVFIVLNEILIETWGGETDDLPRHAMNGLKN